MDIKAKIEEIAKKLMSDKNLMKKFDANPAAVLEEYLGVQLPEEQVNQAVEMIRAKISLDKIGGALGGLFGKK